MPNYLIVGAERESGKPITTVVFANSQNEAAGLVDFMIAEMEEYDEPEPWPKPTSPPSPSPSATKPKSRPDAEFAGMEVAESALMVIAVLGLLIGGIVLLIGIVGVVSAGDEAAETAQGFALLTVGISCFFAGVLFYSFSFVLKALRVIALNSYKQ